MWCCNKASSDLPVPMTPFSRASIFNIYVNVAVYSTAFMTSKSGMVAVHLLCCAGVAGVEVM